jgi:hypothetical protein
MRPLWFVHSTFPSASASSITYTHTTGYKQLIFGACTSRNDCDYIIYTHTSGNNRFPQLHIKKWMQLHNLHPHIMEQSISPPADQKMDVVT